MNINKAFIKIAIGTGTCFLISYLFASFAGINHLAKFPVSLFNHYADALESRAGSELKKSFETHDLDKIQIEVLNSDVVISESDSEAVEVQYYPKNGNALKDQVQNRVLSLREEGEGDQKGFHFDLLRKGSSSSLHLRVPRSMKIFIIKSVSGDVSILHSDAALFQLETISGNLAVTSNSKSEVQIKSVSGSVKVSGHMEKVLAKTISGDLVFRMLNASPEMQLSTTSGNTEIHFDLAPNLKIQFSSVSGAASIIQGEKAISFEKAVAKKLGTGGGSVDVKSIAGDLKLFAP